MRPGSVRRASLGLRRRRFGARPGRSRRGGDRHALLVDDGRRGALIWLPRSARVYSTARSPPASRSVERRARSSAAAWCCRRCCSPSLLVRAPALPRLVDARAGRRAATCASRHRRAVVVAGALPHAAGRRRRARQRDSPAGGAAVELRARPATTSSTRSGSRRSRGKMDMIPGRDDPPRARADAHRRVPRRVRRVLRHVARADGVRASS